MVFPVVQELVDRCTTVPTVFRSVIFAWLVLGILQLILSVFLIGYDLLGMPNRGEHAFVDRCCKPSNCLFEYHFLHHFLQDLRYGRHSFLLVPGVLRRIRRQSSLLLYAGVVLARCWQLR